MAPTDPRALPTVMHRSALLASGVTADEIQRSRRTGQWQTLARGTYCEAAPAAGLNREQQHRLRARALADRSPHLVISHISAAVVLEIPVWDVRLEDVHLTRIGTGGGRAASGRIVHTAALGPDEVITVSGLRLTSMVRTLIDVACTESFASTVVAADAALRRRWVSASALAEALADTRHRRGAAVGRRALTFADGRSESAGESVTRVVFHQLRLPPPQLQVRIYSPNGTFLGRVDLGYPELGLLFEFDGLVKYRKPFRPGQDSADVVVAEKLREERIRDMGYVVVRFVFSELSDPAAMLIKINAGLDRGRRVIENGGILGTWTVDPAQQIPR